MSVYSKVRGTFETLFQLGKSGPQLKNNSGAVEFRNSTDAGYVSIGVNKAQFSGGVIIKNSAGELAVRDSTDANPAQVGASGYRLGSNSLLKDGGAGIVQIRNNADSAFANLESSTVGLNGQSLIKDSGAGVIQFRNAADSADAKITAADPTTGQEVVTYAYFNANPPAGVVKAITFVVDESLGDATQSSSTSIPANATVFSYFVKVTAAFAAGQTLTLGYDTVANALMGTGDSNMEALNTYTIPEPQPWKSSAATVLATLSSATVGTGRATIYVTYGVAQN